MKSRRWAIALVLGCTACARSAGTAPPAPATREPAAAPAVGPEERDRREQEVLAYVLRRHGSGVAVIDSTWSHRCTPGLGGSCARPTQVSPDLWDRYLDAIRSPAAVRDLLPPTVSLELVSTLGETPATPCAQRRSKIELSRVGVSRDGNEAIVSYTVWSPRNHLGCGVVSGETVLLERFPDGQWKVAAPLSFVVS